VNKSILGLAFSCGVFKLCGFQLTDGAACVKHLVKHGAWLDFRGRAGFAEFIWAWVFTSSMLELSNGLGAWTRSGAGAWWCTPPDMRRVWPA